jgi:hypothetical protein
MDSIALHIPVCFENIPKITDGKRGREIANLRTLVREIKVPMYISINGECDQIWIDRVYHAVVWPGTYVKEVFHRENIGYQWGGYYDMFKMLTKFDNDWTHFATLEVDCFLQPGWLEKCLDAGQQHVGMPPYLDHMGRLKWPKHWEKKFSTAKEHTRGGFHFCTKKLLEKIDKKFGCFTYAEGSDLVIDGVCHGEIGFCQKIVAVGSGLHPVDNVCFITELRPKTLPIHKFLKRKVTIPAAVKLYEKKKKKKLLKKREKRRNQKKKKDCKTPEEKKKKDCKTPEEIEKTLLKQKPKPKPKPKKDIIIPSKTSRYRAQRNRLNANN